MEKVICTNCGTENVSGNKYCLNCGYKLPIYVAPAVESVSQEPDTFTTRFNKRKGLFGAIFGIILFSLFIFLIKTFLFNPSVLEKFKTSAIDKALVTFVQEINKNCPIQIDQYTRLDNVKILPGRILKYSYTLSLNKTDVNADELKNQIEPQLLSSIQTNPQLQIFRMNKTTFVYAYHDKNGDPMLEISITPEMYAQ